MDPRGYSIVTAPLDSNAVYRAMCFLVTVVAVLVAAQAVDV